MDTPSEITSATRSMPGQLQKISALPPVTLLLVLGNVLCCLQPAGLDNLVLSTTTACLQPCLILTEGQWRRLIWSAFLHMHKGHLAFNMCSLLWKGSILEAHLGSLPFLWLVVQLLAASHSLLVALTWLALDQQTFFRHQYYNICTVGFNNILFGMKTVAILSVQDRQPHVTGVYIPGKLMCWVELLFIHLVDSDASFMGHFCGILAGLLHIYLSWCLWDAAKVREDWTWTYLQSVMRVRAQPPSYAQLPAELHPLSAPLPVS